MSMPDSPKTIIVGIGETALADQLEPTEIIRHLGEGGMGEVFLCVNPRYRENQSPRLPKKIAVKTLSPEFNQDQELLKRFEAEAKALSPIEHRNVVRLYDWGTFQTGDRVASNTSRWSISKEFPCISSGAQDVCRFQISWTSPFKSPRASPQSTARASSIAI